jgi:hypothetical protein
MWIYDMYKQIQMVILYQKTVLNVVLMLVDIKNQMSTKFSSVKSLNTHMRA